MDKGHQGAAVVIGPQAVETAVFQDGPVGVPRPAGGGLHRVDMRIRQDGRAAAFQAPQVVAAATGLQPLPPQMDVPQSPTL